VASLRRTLTGHSGVAVEGSPETDLPAVLADLELTEPGRAELVDQGWQEFGREAPDRRPVGGSIGGFG
jgi:hypothetical protein